MNNNKSFDVIIVGLGPIGAVLANLLGRLSLSVLVLEKNKKIHPSPRAIHFDGEVMRIFQNAGLAEEVAKIARPSQKGMHFLGANGELLLVRKGKVGLGDQGWENSWYFFQPDLERVLQNALKRYSNVVIRKNETLEKIDHRKACVQVMTLRGRQKTKNNSTKVKMS